jgi:hypothetical protein
VLLCRSALIFRSISEASKASRATAMRLDFRRVTVAPQYGQVRVFRFMAAISKPPHLPHSQITVGAIYAVPLAKDFSTHT